MVTGVHGAGMQGIYRHGSTEPWEHGALGAWEHGALGTRNLGTRNQGEGGGHGELLNPQTTRGPIPRTQNSDFSIILTVYVSQTGRFTPKTAFSTNEFRHLPPLW